MGLAPAVTTAIGAVGTLSQISSQRQQSLSQQKQVEANKRAAEEQHYLNLQRIQYSRDEVTASYLRERMAADAAKVTATQQLAMAQAQQAIANSQETSQIQQLSAGLQGQVNQLFGQASNVNTQASLQQANNLAQVAAASGAARQESLQYIHRLSVGGSPDAANQMIENFILNQIANQQNTQQTNNTIGIVAGYQTDDLKETARQTEAYRSMTTDYMRAQQAINKNFQEYSNRALPSLIDVQSKRNMLMLDAAQAAKMQEIDLAQQTSQSQYDNQQQVMQAQMQSIAQPNYVGAVAGIAAQTVPFLLSNRPQQQQQPSFSGPSLNLAGANRSFTGVNQVLPIVPGNDFPSIQRGNYA